MRPFSLDKSVYTVYTVYIEHKQYKQTTGRQVTPVNILISNASDKPIYEQICEQLIRQILSGQLEPGQALPSIRALAKDLRVSVITTKRAYDELEKGGYLHSVPGKGSYVAEQNSQLVREAYLTRIEEHLSQAADLAKSCGLSREELEELLRLLWEEEGRNQP